MHAEALAYVAQRVKGRRFQRVVEFGSRNVNGSVKPLLATYAYHGIDLAPGRDVDEVADAAAWRGRDLADAIVCCEVLEHAPDVEGIVTNAARNLGQNGLFIITCATSGRTPHSAVDGGPVRPDEHYRNVDPGLLHAFLTEQGFEVEDMQVHPRRGDLYVTARKRANG